MGGVLLSWALYARFPDNRYHLADIGIALGAVLSLIGLIGLIICLRKEVPLARITIDPKLNYHPKFGFFLHGIVHNGNKTVENGRVRLLNVTSNRTEPIQDMHLQWKSGNKAAQDITPNTDRVFDILLINSGRIEFIGYEGVNLDMKQRVGDPGEFHITLQLEGKNVTKRISQKFKIEFQGKGADPIISEE